MRKQRTEYDSPVDALIAITKRLSGYEDRYRISSEEFFNKFCKGLMEDSVDFVEWSNDYQHYVTIKIEIERQLQHVS
ncbi:MAG: hypothetical protein HW390_2217 [Candidatus Brocadiaceae bacterium]|nr:hypothetical protein [Candidatus Brocadiaceae bacterium]